MLQFYGLQHAMCHSSKIMSFRVIWKHIKLKSSQLQCGVYHIGMRYTLFLFVVQCATGFHIYNAHTHGN